jgi:hypothetical protein
MLHGVFEKSTDYDAAYTHKEPSHDDEVLVALRWLFARRASTTSEVLVYAPGKQNLEYSEVVRKDQASLYCVSERTFARDYSWRGGCALALWPTEKGLARLDGDDQVSALAVVPWRLADITPWIRARRPTDLLGLADQAPEPTISNGILLEAMKSLTSMVNLSSGLLHPSDKAHAVDTFRILKKHRIDWDPDGLHAWALANGWTNSGADDLRKYAAGIKAGKSFQTLKGYGLSPTAFDYWKDEVERQSWD